MFYVLIQLRGIVLSHWDMFSLALNALLLHATVQACNVDGYCVVKDTIAVGLLSNCIEGGIC